MHRELHAILVLLTAVMITVVFSGCGKKTASYGSISTSQQPEGQGMALSRNGDSMQSVGGYAEGELEPLDNTGTRPWPDDTTSAEYKATYGRSTAPLLPVYFAFDSSSIDVDQFEGLNTSAAYLLNNGSIQLMVEGNCDERGTADYNIALGEMRAQNVKRYLLNYGVPEGRISTISFGSERPLYLESNEKSWAGNRRADLVVQ